MQKRLTALGLTFAILTLSGCGTPPIKATIISAGDRGGAWIEDIDSGLHYCVSHAETGSPDPICYAARRPSKNDFYKSSMDNDLSPSTKQSSSTSITQPSQDILKEPAKK